jgi:sugar lactone lactonase YvrE
MRHRVLVFLAAMLVCSLAALAVSPQFWESFTQDDLLKGTLTRVSLSSDGKLFLAPAYELVYDTNQPYIFSMVRDKAGNVYAGTGHEGKVYRIDPKGTGTLYFESKELDVFALALDASDTLYVGTSPDGKVYKVTAPNQGTEFCNPDDKYIWSLLFDDGGNLYVGTGGRGLILKVDRSGKKSTFYDTDDTHVVSLAREPGGSLLAGTSPGGRVIQINPQGKAFTLLDTLMEEVRALAVDKFGTIFAVASSSKGLTAPPSLSSKPESAIQTTGGALPLVTIQALSSIADKSGDSKTVTAPGGEKDGAGAKSSIYAITRDGSVETVYTSRDSMVYDTLVRDDGSLLAGTGGKGRLISIDTAKQVSIVTDSPEEQVTRLIASGESILAAGSNQGKVYRLQPQRSQTGTFESRVLDAKTVASWGRISWRITGTSGGAVEISSRAGNTEKPDSSWSDWSTPYPNAAGQPMTSPRARYMQWRANFKRGSSPSAYEVLERVQIAYLQQNVRPQVVSINLLPYGVALQKSPSLQTGTLNLNLSSATTDGIALNSPRERGKEKQPLAPRQVLQPGAQAFTWKATDDNDDNLT